MTPHQFETRYRPLWDELEHGLAQLDAGRRRRGGKPRASRRDRPDAAAPGAGVPADKPPIASARVAQLYRQSCEHLALARERAYPVHLVDRLEALTARAHQRIYRRHDFGLAALRDLLQYEIPEAVRAMGWHLVVAALAFAVPLLAIGITTWLDPHFVLNGLSAEEARNYEHMYGPEAGEHLGRTAGDDWQMFGFYIAHNIGLAFQCYATGLAAGLGSLAMLVFNGTAIGSTTGYLAAIGNGGRIFPFIVTHSAFELTAIVLSGAAGLRLGHTLLAPGRRTRDAALRQSARDTAPVMYCAFAFLVTAAALEAFWSSAGWIEPAVKYGVGAGCWVLVLVYLGLQGRPRPAAGAHVPTEGRP